MNRLTRAGTAELVSRDQILRHERGEGNIHFPFSADHEQDWQPYPVDPSPAIVFVMTFLLLLILLYCNCYSSAAVLLIIYKYLVPLFLDGGQKIVQSIDCMIIMFTLWVTTQLAS